MLKRSTRVKLIIVVLSLTAVLAIVEYPNYRWMDYVPNGVLLRVMRLAIFLGDRSVGKHFVLSLEQQERVLTPSQFDYVVDLAPSLLGDMSDSKKVQGLMGILLWSKPTADGAIRLGGKSSIADPLKQAPVFGLGLVSDSSDEQLFVHIITRIDGLSWVNKMLVLRLMWTSKKREYFSSVIVKRYPSDNSSGAILHTIVDELDNLRVWNQCVETRTSDDMSEGTPP